LSKQVRRNLEVGLEQCRSSSI